MSLLSDADEEDGDDAKQCSDISANSECGFNDRDANNNESQSHYSNFRFCW